MLLFDCIVVVCVVCSLFVCGLFSICSLLPARCLLFVMCLLFVVNCSCLLCVCYLLILGRWFLFVGCLLVAA